MWSGYSILCVCQLLVCLLTVKRTGCELSQSCFTFCKQTIHREPGEKVRYAGHTRGWHVASSFESGNKRHSKAASKEGPADDSDSSVARKKAKLFESGLSLTTKRNGGGTDVEVLPTLMSDSRRPKSIMILPDADISEHETTEGQNPETENTGDMVAEDLCTVKAIRTEISTDERSHFAETMKTGLRYAERATYLT